jgi:THO complex subunit 3
LAVGNKDDVISFIDTRQWKIFRDFNNEGEANEIGWNLHGSHFIITTGMGTVRMLDWPTLNVAHTINAHTASIYSFDLDPRGRYMALGGADAIVSVWDTEDYVCVRTFTSLEWPVRTLSFSYDGEMLAAASEDRFIDIVGVTELSCVSQSAANHALSLNSIMLKVDNLSTEFRSPLLRTPSLSTLIRWFWHTLVMRKDRTMAA